MRFGRVVLVLALLLAVSGCSWMRAMRNKSCHETQPYQKAVSVPPLTIPSGLEGPDMTNALRLPQLKEPAPPARLGKQPCLDEPPPYKVPQPPRVPQA